jgi:alanyl-tRNA synthetase
MPSDPSVLFTTAGMQQFVDYLAGYKDPLQKFGSRHLCSVQKCFRTNDIEEIGDDTHHTLFEMLGNWSIGTDENNHYFKEGAIKYALEFLQSLGFEKEKMWATIYQGDAVIAKDEEAKSIWMQNGIPEERILPCGSDNFWGPTSATGPCGPCSEIHYDRGESFGCGGTDCKPNCPDCKRFVEIWNLVFMQYNKNEKGEFEKLPQTNVDTGSGLERVLTILNGTQSAFESDLFLPLIEELEKISEKKYSEAKFSYRVIVDHIRGACFLVADGFKPDKIGQGYVLRRLVRRAIRQARIIGAQDSFVEILVKKIIEQYQDIYPELNGDIQKVLTDEQEKFAKALENGLKILDKKYPNVSKEGIISGLDAFDLYQTYGFPLELVKEEATIRNYQIDLKGFEDELAKHQEISRAGAAKLFGGHGANEVQDEETKQKVTRLHTATHLLQAALRQVLGESVKQMGSNIDATRLRFDFSFERKMTAEEIKKVEDIVNEQIQKNLIVNKQEMDYMKAMESGALAFFKEKYPEKVNVYSIGDFSKELCGGPHVDCTGKLGKFKIAKEESVAAGVRRIKAVLE